MRFRLATIAVSRDLFIDGTCNDAGLDIAREALEEKRKASTSMRVGSHRHEKFKILQNLQSGFKKIDREA